MPAGERSWFVRHESGAVAWAMVRPFDDGSAVLRTATEYQTYAPPNGPKDAVDVLTQVGFVPLERAVLRGLVAADAQPPAW